ncbi:Epoxyqueuosine reductase [Phycisphaerae bacterium RAS1]|nr:Epoxyqueuosine reductase [Phycisphaerae bacterium RAS1]
MSAVSSVRMTPLATADRIKAAAIEIGFDLVGVTHAGRLARAAYYRDWLARDYHGRMAYLSRRADLRESPAELLAGAKSIICVALNYKRETPPRPSVLGGGTGVSPVPGTEGTGETPVSPRASAAAQPNAASTAQPIALPAAPTGQIAIYARGRDYHSVMKRMLWRLIERMQRELAETFDARPFVDTGPLIERELAARAGLGWIGKNTCVLSARLGSYFFLGEIVTTLDLPGDEPATDHCGACTRCLDACPTRAFVAPYQMDASRCISYLTIENPGDIPPDLAPGVGDWVFGCDDCQQVCPFNAKAPLATNAEITENRLPERIDLLSLLNLRAGEYRRLTRGTAAARAPRAAWRRNAAVALENGEVRSQK